MAIENKNLFITIEEFKDSIFYDNDLFGNEENPNEATNDNNINLAIDMASNNIDYLSGFSISEKWPEEEETDWTNNIKLATAHYVRYALTKGVDYIRGQQSLSIAGISEAINNPDDPYFIPPDVFNYLRKAKEYRSFKGFELEGVIPNRNKTLFSKFGSNSGEDSPWNRFLKIVNLFGIDGIKIDVTHPQNILGPVVTISFDKNLIPDISNKSDISYVDEQDNKLNQLIDNLDKTIVNHTNDIVELKENKADKNYVNDQDKEILKEANSFAIKAADNAASLKADKSYVDIELNKKQNILTAGNGINIENNIISATGTGDIDWSNINQDNINFKSNNIEKIHIDHETVQLYDKNGNSVAFIRDDIRFTRISDNAVTFIINPVDGTVKYGRNFAPVEIATKDDLKQWNLMDPLSVTDSNITFIRSAGLVEYKIFIWYQDINTAPFSVNFILENIVGLDRKIFYKLDENISLTLTTNSNQETIIRFGIISGATNNFKFKDKSGYPIIMFRVL